jgi:excisionase family DNA binding protein
MTMEALIAEAVAARLQPQIDALRAKLEQLQGFAPELIPLPEAAKRLGVGLRAVQQWCKDGRLKVVQVGGSRLVRWPGATDQS